jgi:hypothetical protein
MYAAGAQATPLNVLWMDKTWKSMRCLSVLAEVPLSSLV